MPFEPGNKLGKKIQPGEVKNPDGRPKKYLTTLKDMGYKMSEVEDTLKVLFILDEGELKKVAADKKATILERTIAKAFLKGLKGGSLFNIMQVLERTFGKPRETVDHNLKTSYNITLDLGNGKPKNT